MELTQHPEYPAYVRDKDAAQHCQQATTAWKASIRPSPAGITTENRDYQHRFLSSAIASTAHRRDAPGWLSGN